MKPSFFSYLLKRHHRPVKARGGRLVRANLSNTVSWLWLDMLHRTLNPDGGPHMDLLFLEVADVARQEGIVTATVRKDVAAGHLRVAARTARGTRLFRPKD